MLTHTIEDLTLILSHYTNCTLNKKWIYVKDAISDDYVSHIPFKEKDAIDNFVENFPLDKVKKELIQQQVTWLPFSSYEFPENLIHCYNPPLGIYIKGKGKYLQEKMLSIVGSRKATDYGKLAVKHLLPDLVKNEFTIVSGLARGIDTSAHKEAMNLGGKTIAVIGTGIDVAYPYENKWLQDNMGLHQLVISEYPLGTQPHKSHFPMRNRIIASLSAGTLVIEAKYRSGSLITSNIALNEGKEVFAVPGSIFHDLSKGTNDLIKHGAVAVLDAQDILDTFEFL